MLLITNRSSAHQHKRHPAAGLPVCSEASSLSLREASAENSSKEKQRLPAHIIMAKAVTNMLCKTDLFLCVPLLGRLPTHTWSLAQSSNV